MLTASEIGTANAALERARLAVEATEAAAEDARNWLSYVGIADAVTRNALETAAAERRLYGALRARLSAAIEAPEFQHEEALEVVQLANRLAARGTAATITTTARNASVPHATGDVVTGTLRTLGILPDPDGKAPTLPRWLWVVAGLVVLVLLVPLLTSALTLARAARR